jgi:Flp pilus assembly protein TadG
VGSNTLPAGSIAVSPNNSSFTALTGMGTGYPVTVWSAGAPPTSSSPQTIYVQVTAPSSQPDGQYSGTFTVEVDVNHTP